MLESIKNIFRRRALKKYRCTRPTGLLPLKYVRTAIIMLDVNCHGFDELRHDVNLFFRNHNIRPDIYFLDFRKLENDELLLTSIQTTILLKDLDWLGKPNIDKLPSLTDGGAELFISLVPGEDFPIKFMCNSASARFKVGITEYQDHPFDLVVSGSDDPGTCFKQIKSCLEKITDK